MFKYVLYIRNIKYTLNMIKNIKTNLLGNLISYFIKYTFLIILFFQEKFIVKIYM